jgi:hypothetical protein
MDSHDNPHRRIEPASPAGPSFSLYDALPILTLAIVAILVLGRDITVGGLRYGDAPAHAMDGVLIHDWIRAGPDAWRNPLQFAEQQYAHYPTLGIGRHYPPAFALVEAAFFVFFGISAATSRAAVLFFALVAVTGLYRLVRSLARADRPAAFLAAVAWLTMPATVQWGRDTMLEVPLMAGLALSAAAFVAYLQSPTARRLALANVVMFTTLFLKQTGVFLFPAAAATIFFGFQSRRFPRSHAVAQLVVSLAALAVAALSLDGHGANLLRGDATYADRWSWTVWTGYLQILPSQVGLITLLLAVPGAMILYRWNPMATWFLGFWFASCWAMLTFADFKYDRYIYPALLPFAVCAGIVASALLRYVPLPRLQPAVTATLALVACGYAWSFPTRIRPDYGSLVSAHRSSLEGRVVFFSGLREGDFIFAARQLLPWRSTVVVRGSKLLYTCNGRPDLDLVPLVTRPDLVAVALEPFGFASLFVEREDRTGVAQEHWLRSYLSETNEFRRTAEHLLTAAPATPCRDVIVDVYESSRPPALTDRTLEVPIPRAGRTVRIPLSLAE